MKPKNKNKKNIYYEPDSSSDSDTPLVVHRPSSINNEINSLFKYSVEKCEFCDKIFNNKYNMLVHNAKHIIIPLLNQNLHKCTQCHRMFNSVESLEWHSINSHAYISDNKDYLPKILQSIVQKQPMMVLMKEPLCSTDSTVTKSSEIVNGDDNVPEILQSMVLKQPVTMVTRIDPVITNIESLVKKEPETLLKKEPNFGDDAEVYYVSDNNDSENNAVASTTSVKDDITIFDSDDEDMACEDVDIKTENVFEYINSRDCESLRNTRIKDRIMFEDDGDIDFSLVNSNTVNPDGKKDPSNLRKNAIIIGNKTNASENQEVNAIATATSVHNDELKKPGLFKCKKCSNMFPSRYEAIVHEKIHIRIRRPRAFVCCYCDWYVTNNPYGLLRHKKLNHADGDTITKPALKCKDCNLLYFNLKRHKKNYHRAYRCRHCRDIFPSKFLRNEHVVHTHRNVLTSEVTLESGDPQWKPRIKTMKMCDICYQWLRDREDFKCQFVKNYSKVGEQVQCERCVKMFFELKVVRTKWPPLKRFRRPDNMQKQRILANKRPMSNADRLRNVQQRLKKLKKLNKF